MRSSEEWNVPSMRRQDLIVVVTSVGSEEQALDIAHALIRNRQAACVNLIPNVHSIYRWKGRVCDDGEFLLLIKTRASEFPRVRDTIQKLNTYELPEVLAYRVDEASPAFSEWISRTTEPRKRKLRKKAAAGAPAAPVPIRRRAASR
jgi:periplasmic divalent cation tolerance protein